MPGTASAIAKVTPALHRERLLARFRRGTSTPPAAKVARGWDELQIAALELKALASEDSAKKTVYRALARVMAALLMRYGRSWGTWELVSSIALDIASNECGADAIGRAIEPLLAQAAAREGYRLLPAQDSPVIMNTKGASASGKSTLRPLQKQLAGAIGVQWSDFALISPDIWRKQLLDYDALGVNYRYAGSFTGDELQIIDQKLDRYMARKAECGRMSHLLIDRFRFDSFAADSDEAAVIF